MKEHLDLQRTLSPAFASLAKELANNVSKHGGQLYLVGGTVRDLLLSYTPDELDIEVHGLTAEELTKCLEPNYKLNQVGKSFGVIKLKGLPVEIALPRIEVKSGTGHKGFIINVEPNLSFKKAAYRRDFTINAMGIDPLTGKLEDPYGGQKDLKEKILRNVSPAFKEDPLRVLRGMQFASRFHLFATPETIDICQTMDLEGLANERIFDEWKKLLLKGKSISHGLTFLKQTNWLSFFPELMNLVNCQQDPEWHPEGDVWTHTLHCMDAFAKKRIGDPWEDLIVGFATLCHDFGKPQTTVIETDGRIRSPKHESVGERPTQSFLERLTNQKEIIEQVIPLVKRHLAPRTFFIDKAGDSAIRRLARQVLRIDRLVRVAEADIAGRPPRKDEFPEGKWLLERAEKLRIKATAPEPIIQGRHLIKKGCKPGPNFSPILKNCFEAQLDGKFNKIEQGLTYLEQLLNSKED
jgi:tRNA nucleotidyltransferase (CCA-adding enzyme)